MFESQIADYLESFRIPDDYQEQILLLYSNSQAERDNDDLRRHQIEARLERIKELYSWGDLDRDAYRRERDSLNAELATLSETADLTAVLEQAAKFLSDLPSAWNAATQEQRNQLGRLLFVNVELKDDRVEAVTPQPEFAPFFLIDCQLREESSKVRKRRA